ncbi:MAG: bifunctional DNA primase/polymerase [Micropruina sp.]
MTPEEQSIADAMAADDWAEAERLGGILDAQPRPVPDLLASALWYASIGLQVFPLQPGRKVPFTGSNGCKDATTDAAMIRRWWAAAPNANIGIATGHLVDVIDIDGAPGIRSWLDLEAPPEAIGNVRTPRPGGSHHYLRATGRGNRAGIFPGIDYRGLGGYVLAPPSWLDEQPGQPYSGHYTWSKPLAISPTIEQET